MDHGLHPARRFMLRSTERTADMKTRTGSAFLAGSAVILAVSLAAAMEHGDPLEAASVAIDAVSTPSLAAGDSKTQQAGTTPNLVCLAFPTSHPSVVLSRQLQDAALAQGGVEINSAGFHQFPGSSMTSLFAYPTLYAVRDLNGTLTGVIRGMQVDLRREAVLSLGVVDTNVVANGAMYDLQVRFNASIPPYAQEKQKAREWALSNGWTPNDEGVALIHSNFIYGDFTYGAIAVAAASGGWVTVVSGTSFNEATAIAQALHP